MGKIYVDVTVTVWANFVTGIQRVTRNIVIELIGMDVSRHLCLLFYDEQHKCFRHLSQQDFLSWAEKSITTDELRMKALNGKICSLENFSPVDILLDLDSVWSEKTWPRPALYPRLKSVGTKIITYVYDVIPVTWPQFVHNNTLVWYLTYLGALLNYADCVITSTQTVLDELSRIAEDIDVTMPCSSVSWLGSDFLGTEIDEDLVDNVVREQLEGKKYILIVGTIEPRKNHRLLLDAFEQKLFAEGVSLVLVGRKGWKAESLTRRIITAPEYGEQLLWLQHTDDMMLGWLYKHALSVAVMTFEEGFCLPVIEALQYGVPVIASDIPVLREVGQDFCEFFPVNDEQAFIEKVMYWLNDEEAYMTVVRHVHNFQGITWHETASNIVHAVQRMLPVRSGTSVYNHITQMFILSARLNDFSRAIPFIDAFMPFIEEIVVCCPNSMADELEKRDFGRLNIKLMRESDVLNGQELPEDHATRNMFLRSLAMQSNLLDDAFIMSDDDYRPLQKLTLETFIKDGHYQAYYCYDLLEWQGSDMGFTSFDKSEFRSRDFLIKNGYPTKMFASHMPQVIDKRIFKEMLESHQELQLSGMQEWDVYFNYLQSHYPYLLECRPHVTLCWPGSPTDWQVRVQAEEYLFENFYESAYEDNGIFAGFSKEYISVEKMIQENVEKIEIYKNSIKKVVEKQEVYESFVRGYVKDTGVYPTVNFMLEDGQLRINTPSYLLLPKGGVATRIQVYVDMPEEVATELSVHLKVVDEKDVFNRNMNFQTENYRLHSGLREWPIATLLSSARGKLCIVADLYGKLYMASVPVFLYGSGKITRKEFIDAYRFLLDREPESEQVIWESICSDLDIKTLRAKIVNSAEFKKNWVSTNHLL